MPPSPTQTRGWLRGKNGWFTERSVAVSGLEDIDILNDEIARRLSLSIDSYEKIQERVRCIIDNQSLLSSCGKVSRILTSGKQFADIISHLLIDYQS